MCVCVHLPPFLPSWRADAKNGGGAANTARKTIMRHKMNEGEAMQILNMDKTSMSTEAVERNFKKYFEANDPKKGGSFYLQSKVFRAKEALDFEAQRNAEGAGSAAGDKRESDGNT